MKAIDKIKPDLIIISGDLTQRATEKEYAEAKAFIDKLYYPVFVIPGNHDIPLYNVFRRMISPYKKYFKFISSNLSPVYTDKEIAVIGINTVRRSTISSGRISKKQIKETTKILEEIDPEKIKIIVCHHPFDLPTRSHHAHTHKVVARAKTAMNHLSQQKVDMFLAGHLHLSHAGDTTSRYKIKDYSGLIIQAGTAISKRSRGEPVSFNVLKINKPEIVVEHYSGDPVSKKFLLSSSRIFKSNANGWQENI